MYAVVPISLFFLNFSLYLRDSSHIVDLILRIASQDVLNYELPLIAHLGRAWSLTFYRAALISSGP